MRTDIAIKIPQMLNKEGKFQEDPQNLGSVVTYLRRYSLAAITGLAVEGVDDDAEGASSTLRNGKPHLPEQKPQETQKE